MKEPLKTLYVKRTQKDYSLSLKLQIVREIEAGKLGITEFRKKICDTILLYNHKLASEIW